MAAFPRDAGHPAPRERREHRCGIARPGTPRPRELALPSLQTPVRPLAPDRRESSAARSGPGRRPGRDPMRTGPALIGLVRIAAAAGIPSAEWSFRTPMGVAAIREALAAASVWPRRTWPSRKMIRQGWHRTTTGLETRRRACRPAAREVPESGLPGSDAPL